MRWPCGDWRMKRALIGARMGLTGSSLPRAPMPALQNRWRQPHQAPPHERPTLSPAQRSAVIAPAPQGRRSPALPVSLAPRADGRHTARAWRRDRCLGGRAGGFSFVFNGVTDVTPCCVSCNAFFSARSKAYATCYACYASRAPVMSRARPSGAIGAFSYARGRRNNRNRHKKRERLLFLSMLHLLRLGVTGRNSRANKNRVMPA